MSGHTKLSENYLTSTTSSSITKAQPLSSTKNSSFIDSKQSVILPSTDNKAKGSVDDISAQQILNSNYQTELLEPNKGPSDSSVINVAPSNDRKVELSYKNSERAVDFFNLDKETSIDSSWNPTTTRSKSTILRDCSDSSSHANTVYYYPTSELKASDSRLNISSAPTDHGSSNDSLINIDDNNKRSLKSVTTTRSIQSSTLTSHSNSANNFNNTRQSSGTRFESLLVSDSELVNSTNDHELGGTTSIRNTSSLGASNLYPCDSTVSRKETRRNDDSQRITRQESRNLLNETSINELDRNEDDEDSQLEEVNEEQIDKRYRTQSPKFSNDHLNNRSKSRSYFNRLQLSLSGRLFDRFSTSLFGNNSSDSSELDLRSTSEHPYTKYEDKDLLTGTSKYSSGKRTRKLSTGRTFRGTYKYSRAKISMAIFKRMISLLVQRSTLSLLGAFLIHVTLGTVYTLSNINSYLTSYMRQHGSPNATYGGSMWISSLYAVGQGFSMVLGGYIEKRFSARIACLIGCALHSVSIMSTSWTVDYGPLAVLMTYGFLPGFGCGLAYMTPMSNGFGWFPNRKGLVAGVILAGFGIGTFIFNMAQTAYVNPENLSPPDDANGYFTQKSILDKVPHLFVFIGTIYASMQFIGCCLLFKPPNTYTSAKGLDERPILVETEMPLKRSIQRREFIVLFLVYGITTQGVLFVNSMIKEYGQIFIGNDMYLAWTGSMASIANSLGRLSWGLAIDRFSFTQCFTSITIIFGALMFIMPFEFILSSKLLYLLCTLGIFGSFSGWMSTYPVHLSRVFGRTNSGMIYGLIFISQSLGGILTAIGAHYLIDHYNRFVPFFCVVLLEIIGLAIYHLFYPK